MCLGRKCISPGTLSGRRGFFERIFSLASTENSLSLSQAAVSAAGPSPLPLCLHTQTHAATFSRGERVRERVRMRRVRFGYTTGILTQTDHQASI